MKKLTARHIITKKGGRIAAREKRHAFKTVARVNTTANGSLGPALKGYKRIVRNKSLSFSMEGGL